MCGNFQIYSGKTGMFIVAKLGNDTEGCNVLYVMFFFMFFIGWESVEMKVTII